MNSNYLAKFDEINALLGINTSSLNSLLNDAYNTLNRHISMVGYMPRIRLMMI